MQAEDLQGLILDVLHQAYVSKVLQYQSYMTYIAHVMKSFVEEPKPRPM